MFEGNDSNGFADDGNKNAIDNALFATLSLTSDDDVAMQDRFGAWANAEFGKTIIKKYVEEGGLNIVVPAASLKRRLSSREFLDSLPDDTVLVEYTILDDESDSTETAYDTIERPVSVSVTENATPSGGGTSSVGDADGGFGSAGLFDELEALTKESLANVPVAEPEPIAEPEPVAEPEPIAEPEPVAEPQSEPVTTYRQQPASTAPAPSASEPQVSANAQEDADDEYDNPLENCPTQILVPAQLPTDTSIDYARRMYVDFSPHMFEPDERAIDSLMASPNSMIADKRTDSPQVKAMKNQAKMSIRTLSGLSIRDKLTLRDMTKAKLAMQRLSDKLDDIVAFDPSLDPQAINESIDAFNDGLAEAAMRYTNEVNDAVAEAADEFRARYVAAYPDTSVSDINDYIIREYPALREKLRDAAFSRAAIIDHLTNDPDVLADEGMMAILNLMNVHVYAEQTKMDIEDFATQEATQERAAIAQQQQAREVSHRTEAVVPGPEPEPEQMGYLDFDGDENEPEEQDEYLSDEEEDAEEFDDFDGEYNEDDEDGEYDDEDENDFDFDPDAVFDDSDDESFDTEDDEGAVIENDLSMFNFELSDEDRAALEDGDDIDDSDEDESFDDDDKIKEKGGLAKKLPKIFLVAAIVTCLGIGGYALFQSHALDSILGGQSGTATQPENPGEQIPDQTGTNEGDGNVDANAGGGQSANASDEHEDLKRMFEKYPELNLVVDGESTRGTIEGYSDDGAIVTTDGGDSLVLTWSQLEAYVETYPELFDDGSSSDADFDTDTDIDTTNDNIVDSNTDSDTDAIDSDDDANVDDEPSRDSSSTFVNGDVSGSNGN